MTEERPMPTAVARATGICLVVYSYLGGLWLDRHGQRFGLVDEVREWLNRPLGIGEDFGVLGLMLLLLASGCSAVSASRASSPAVPRSTGSGPAMSDSAASGPTAPGAVISKPATSVSRPTMVGVDIRRLVRIAVPLSVATVLAVAFRLLDVEVLIRPLAWVVGIELVIWLTGALTARTHAWFVPLAQLVVVAGLLAAGGVSPQLAVPVVLFPLAVLGQVIGRLPGWAVLLFGLAVWGLLVWTEHVYPGVAAWWYPLTALCAVLYFLITVRADATVGTRPIVRWLAGHARWLLVLTGTLGWAVLGLGLPFPLGFVLGLGAILAVSGLARRTSRPGEVLS
jgi:hypothetical protein